MTTAQKIIKYLAIALAIFLIISISSIIISIVGGIAKGFTFNSSYSINENNNCENYLGIGLVGSSLRIIKDKELFADNNNNDNIEISQNGNRLVIKEKKFNFKFFNKENNEITVHVPSDMKFCLVDIESGAGKLDIDVINTSKLDLKLGAGSTTINYLSSEETNIESGIGSLDIKEGKMNNSKLELGIGSININTIMLGNNSIETGIGKLNLKLNNQIEDYKFKFEKGIGSINLNGNDIANNTELGNGHNSINIEGGIGSINIITK